MQNYDTHVSRVRCAVEAGAAGPEGHGGRPRFLYSTRASKLGIVIPSAHPVMFSSGPFFRLRERVEKDNSS